MTPTQVFRFRLATLLRVRRLREEQARLEMAKLLKSLAEMQQAVDTAENLRAQCLALWHQPRKEGLTAPEYQIFHKYINSLRFTIAELLGQIRQQEMIIKTQQEKLTKLSQERRLLESLRDKRLLRFKQALTRQVQKQADELALLGRPR